VALDAVGTLLDFLSNAILGWRCALNLGCGAALAGLIAWVRPPRTGEMWALVVLVLLCYVLGLWWEFFAMRRRRRDAA